jgi:hypothetical protein
MWWVSIITLIGFIWLVGKVSAMKFDGINIVLLILASMVILFEILSGRNILEKPNTGFLRLTDGWTIRDEGNGLVEQAYQEAA